MANRFSIESVGFVRDAGGATPITAPALACCMVLYGLLGFSDNIF
jgi:hypothetical protein